MICYYSIKSKAVLLSKPDLHPITKTLILTTEILISMNSLYLEVVYILFQEPLLMTTDYNRSIKAGLSYFGRVAFSRGTSAHGFLNYKASYLDFGIG